MKTVIGLQIPENRQEKIQALRKHIAHWEKANPAALTLPGMRRELARLEKKEAKRSH